MQEQKTFKPRIEMFSPFTQPFSQNNTEIVADEVIQYMNADNTKVVAKCTPCQCCACR